MSSGGRHPKKAPKSSRIPDQARDYISEVAGDRELERFMVFSSTASSGASGSTHSLVPRARGSTHRACGPPPPGGHSSEGSGSGSACETALAALGAPKRRCRGDAEQEPAAPRDTAPLARPLRAARRVAAPEDIVTIIPIQLVEDGGRARPAQAISSATQTHSLSAEDLRTPTKATHAKKTQTPESALKTHKRLEWDPAADVGYYKRAQSSSNISTLERSVLEVCGWRQSQSEDLLADKQADAGTPSASLAPLAPLTPLAAPAAEKPTPAGLPLASSTLVNRGAMPPGSCSSSLRSLAGRAGRPREGESQSSRSSRRESLSQATSLYGSSVASSFDYNSAGPEKGVPANANANEKETERHPPAKQGKQRTESKAESREREREQERQYTAAQLEKVRAGRRRAKGNKENVSVATSTSTTTTTTGSSSGCGHKDGAVDLGIDLLCSLVQSRSLSETQKKNLVRNLARRISCLEWSESGSSRSADQVRARAEAGAEAEAALQCKDVATNTSQTSCSRGAPPVPAPRTRIPAKPPAMESRAASASSAASRSSTSASHEVITQKTNVPAGLDVVPGPHATHAPHAPPAPEAASTDAETAEGDGGMPEWLNPMTQSEFDYEERLRPCSDAERLERLNWVETEIRRLLRMRHMLNVYSAQLALEEKQLGLGRQATSAGLIVAEPDGEQAEVEQAPRQLPVECQGRPPIPPPRSTSVTAPPPLKKLPPIPTDSSASWDMPTPSPTQPPPPPPPPARQEALVRRKIATPVLRSSPSDGGRSESVCSFVQQRQRQFREHYENQQHQQMLLQRQQLHLIEQQCQQQCQQQRRHSPAPHRQGRAGEQEYALAQSPLGVYCCADLMEPAYYQALRSQARQSGKSAARRAVPTAATKTTTTTTTAMTMMTTTTNSSSSVLCFSSDMSVPMGTVNTCETTTTTTTHQYDDVACQRIRRSCRGQRDSDGHVQMRRQTLQVRPSGVSYTIQFADADSEEGQVLPVTSSLQEQLQLARPEFCAKSKQRKAILNQMQMLRTERRREMEELLMVEGASVETLDRRLQEIAPQPTDRPRVFSTREMKALTIKRCRILPEVVAAQDRERELRRRRANRLMRDVFNKRMKSRVAQGQVSLNHSVNII